MFHHKFLLAIHLLFGDVLANEAEDDNSEDAADFTDGWSGNKRRKLWKTSCTRAALDVRIIDNLCFIGLLMYKHGTRYSATSLRT